MSTGKTREIIRTPGVLVKDPTDISMGAAVPFGGTQLGLTRSIALDWNVRVADVTAEEFGGQVVEKLYAGESAAMAAVLRSYDSDALASVFPLTATGSATGEKVISYELLSAARPGYRLSTLASKILFVPAAPALDDSDPDPVDDQPWILLRNAIPQLVSTTRLNLSLRAEWGVGVVWAAMPQADGKVYQIGKRGDIAL